MLRVRISGGQADVIFRARVSPRERAFLRQSAETGEIREHPRCRNGRTTFTRRNWPSKRSAMTVSGYFAEGPEDGPRPAVPRCVRAYVRACVRGPQGARVRDSRVLRVNGLREADRSAISLVSAPLGVSVRPYVRCSGRANG